MNRLIVLALIALAPQNSQAQMLLSQDQSYTYTFANTDLQDFGDGYTISPRGFSTFYTDASKSSAGATYRLELFENDISGPAIATVNGSGNVTATALNAWQDLNGVARVTVTSGDVFFDALRVNVYVPDGFGTQQLWTTDLVPVPEPGTVSLMAIGAVGLLGWTLQRRRR